jgi:ribosomal-protein-alanine N-acetyltransferase
VTAPPSGSIPQHQRSCCLGKSPGVGICRIGLLGSVDEPAIRSARLDLVSMSPAFLEALLDGRRDEAATLLGAPLPDGWPGEHDEGFLRLRLTQMREDPDSRQWLVRAIILRDSGAMAGHAGFHGPPGAHGLPAETVELGYTVFPPFRNRGYATEVAVALAGWAEARGMRHLVASVSPGNEPSLAIIRKLGFVQTGEQWDEEDGLELVFKLDLSSAP